VKEKQDESKVFSELPVIRRKNRRLQVKQLWWVHQTHSNQENKRLWTWRRKLIEMSVTVPLPEPSVSHCLY
jgi:hypothetical protein